MRLSLDRENRIGSFTELGLFDPFEGGSGKKAMKMA